MSNLIDSLLRRLDIDRCVSISKGTNTHAILRDNERLEDMEKYCAEPNSTRRAVMHTAFGSFLDYLDRFKNPETSVYVGTDLITAVIDHPGATPEWEVHTSNFRLEPTNQAKMWQQAVTEDGARGISQTDFALLLERRAGDVLRPSAADMLEIALTLEASKSVLWKSGVRLQNGDRQLTYEETTAAKAGIKGTVKIPEKFEITLPLWEGAPPVKMDVRMRYRLNNGSISFHLEWVDLAEAKNTTLRTLRDIIEDKHKVRAYLGTSQTRYANGN